MKSLKNVSNDEKAEISALLGDALQSANGLRYQIEGIQEAFDDSIKFQESMQGLNMLNHELEELKNALDGRTDWKVVPQPGYLSPYP